jgi:hypothetical protein
VQRLQTTDKIPIARCDQRFLSLPSEIVQRAFFMRPTMTITSPNAAKIATVLDEHSPF